MEQQELWENTKSQAQLLHRPNITTKKPTEGNPKCGRSEPTPCQPRSGPQSPPRSPRHPLAARCLLSVFQRVGHLANERKIALGMAQLLAPTSARLLWAMINTRAALTFGSHGGEAQAGPGCKGSATVAPGKRPRGAHPWGVLAPCPLPACTPPALLVWVWVPRDPVCAPVGKGLR